MDTRNVEELVAKYNAGLADPEEIRSIEQLIEQGKLDLVRLNDLSKLDEQIKRADDPVPSMEMDHTFYSMLNSEKRKAEAPSIPVLWPSWVPRLALAVVILGIGFAGGFYARPSGGEVARLTQEVSDLKEMVMLSLLEKESASERLRAVSLTIQMEQASGKVTGALIQTLNQDPNVNVRLAALDALVVYAGDPDIRKALVGSIALQDSPLVQMALAEYMVALQEKSSIKEFTRILEDRRTPEEVKRKIKESLQVLI
jgi:hypothetical protein